MSPSDLHSAHRPRIEQSYNLVRRRLQTESEEEAPISGLNHLGSYLADMRRDLGSPEESVFRERHPSLELVVNGSSEDRFMMNTGI